ncbi:hypothetical protein [uncultured Ruminococcus sp.]|uniref:hypothetical protein n=1 Tax=uncultured Ruminococcus sp. TaxID=165186 RepID=UPI0025ECA259|nr:hypothetical protein [uncultured Ruminococcus sp.]
MLCARFFLPFYRAISRSMPPKTISPAFDKAFFRLCLTALSRGIRVNAARRISLPLIFIHAPPRQTLLCARFFLPFYRAISRSMPQKTISPAYGKALFRLCLTRQPTKPVRP